MSVREVIIKMDKHLKMCPDCCNSGNNPGTSNGGNIDLTPYARKDAAGLSSANAQAWAEAIKPYVQTGGGTVTPTPTPSRIPTLSQVLNAGNTLDGNNLEGNFRVTTSDVTAAGNKDTEFVIRDNNLEFYSQELSHKENLAFRASLSDLHYNSLVKNGDSFGLHLAENGYEINIPDKNSGITGTNLNLKFDSQYGLYSGKVFPVTENNQYIQKKYLDDRLAGLTTGGGGSVTTSAQTLGQVLATGNDLDGKEIAGNFVLKTNPSGGPNYTYKMGSSGIKHEYYGIDDSFDYIYNTDGLILTFNNEKNSVHYTTNFTIEEDGIIFSNDGQSHESGMDFKASKTYGIYFSTWNKDVEDSSSFTFNENKLELNFSVGGSSNNSYIDVTGIHNTEYLEPASELHYTQKKYVDTKIKSEISNIVVGGNNLVKNTSIPLFTPNSSDSGTPAVMKDATGYFVRYTPASNKAVGLYGFRVPGSNLGNHTRSIEVRHSHTSDLTIWGQTVPPNKWVRLVQEKFTSPIEFASIATNVAGVSLDLRKYKIELGTKATDWTPNIEEFSTATSSRKIDEVFTINEEGIFTNQRDGNVIITGVPYANDIAIVLEMYIIFADGVVTKIDNLQNNASGELFFPASLASRDVVTKFYLKALIK